MGRGIRGRACATTSIVALLVAVLTGCADSERGTDGDATAAPAATDDLAAATPTGFAADFQQVIDRYGTRAQELQSETQDIPEGDEQRLLDLLEQLRANAVTAREDLAELTVPSPVSAEMTTILQLLDDQAAALDALGQAVRERDDTEFQAATAELIEIAQQSAEARRRMDAALQRCGRSCS